MMRRPLSTLCHGSRGRFLRVVLALLIALTPLASIAASPTAQMPDPAGASEDHASMPCHGDAAPRLVDSDCPHCNGDAAAAQCHCSAVPMPGGVTTSFLTPSDHSGGDGICRVMTSDALPDSPGELLFRPPIPSHA